MIPRLGIRSNSIDLLSERDNANPMSLQELIDWDLYCAGPQVFEEVITVFRYGGLLSYLKQVISCFLKEFFLG